MALCLGLPRWAGTRKVKPIWISLKQESEWHQLGHMQVRTSLQTDNHASTPPLSCLQVGCPSYRPTNSVKALKAQHVIPPNFFNCKCMMTDALEYSWWSSDVTVQSHMSTECACCVCESCTNVCYTVTSQDWFVWISMNAVACNHIIWYGVASCCSTDSERKATLSLPHSE